MKDQLNEAIGGIVGTLVFVGIIAALLFLCVAPGRREGPSDYHDRMMEERGWCCDGPTHGGY